MRGTPPRPYHWIADPIRRAKLEAAARTAYPSLRYRRQQRSGGPVHIYQVTLEVPGYESRLITVEFQHRECYLPKIYADGPAGEDASPHRFSSRGRTRLCIWYEEDPEDRRWVPEDGLLMLFGMAAEHLLKEAWWREHGEWLGDEAPHGELIDTGPAETKRDGS